MDDLIIISINISGLRTKQHHIIQLTRKYKPDFILIQETNIHSDVQGAQIKTQLGFKHAYFSLAVHNIGSGTAILQTSDRWNILNTNRDNQGRITFVQIGNNTHTYTIVNIHAPPNYNYQPQFYEELDTILINTYRGQNVILCGDYNCVLEDSDIVGGMSGHR